jgi:hypothetical protein
VVVELDVERGAVVVVAVGLNLSVRMEMTCLISSSI